MTDEECQGKLPDNVIFLFVFITVRMPTDGPYPLCLTVAVL